MIRSKASTLTAVIAAIFLVLTVVYLPVLYSTSKQEVVVKIEDKERIVEREGNSYYLVFTDQGVYKLEDDLFFGNFNSSDWYGKLKRDSTYTITTVGWRVGLLSSYPNIVKVQDSNGVYF